MRTLLAAAALAAVAGAGAHAQPLDPSVRAAFPDRTKWPPVYQWYDRVGAAKTRAEKLKLLQEAWDKQLDERLPTAERKAWFEAWQWVYTREAQSAAMPNPYDPRR